jgi:sugar O-acyltransferase (sialic acid O-acetyltransferase NeuD family)
MQRIVIIGAGGHSQVVADVLLAAAAHGAQVTPIGFLDDNPVRHNQLLLGLPVLGGLGRLAEIDHDAVIVAIGDNAVRRRIFQQLSATREVFATAIHPAAVLGSAVEVGAGSVLCARVVVNACARIGANVILNTGCTIDHHNQIGDHAHIAPGVHTGGDVTIGEGGFIGIGATVMPQRCVGAWTTVGAAGLVQRDLPDHVVAIGSPARIVRSVEHM